MPLLPHLLGAAGQICLQPHVGDHQEGDADGGAGDDVDHRRLQRGENLVEAEGGHEKNKKKLDHL